MSRQQIEVVAGVQIGLVAGLRLTGNEGHVIAALHAEIAAGADHGRLVFHPIVLRRHLLAGGEAVLLVRRRRQGHVAPGGEGDVAARFEGAGHCAEVAPGADVQVPPGTDFGAELGHAL